MTRRGRAGPGGRRRRLEPALQGLMGEANLRFARGDAETAERMCMEVIRQVSQQQLGNRKRYIFS